MLIARAVMIAPMMRIEFGTNIAFLRPIKSGKVALKKKEETPPTVKTPKMIPVDLAASAWLKYFCQVVMLLIADMTVTHDVQLNPSRVDAEEKDDGGLTGSI